MKEVAITIKNVSKDFHFTSNRAGTIKSVFTSAFRNKEKREKDIQHALKNVTLDIPKGEFFGIVGRNGSGKSTLLKMIAGIYQPNKGKIAVNGKLVPFIELGVGFNPELTGRENVYLNGALLGFSKKEVSKMYPAIVEFAELEKFMDQKLKNYSSGMQVRLAFSMAVRAQADILLIDEVLAVGDADFQRKCFEYFKELKQKKKTVIFVTHDMNAVREYCDRAALIDNSEIKYVGKPDDIAKEYSFLFMQEDDKNVSTDPKQKRWGNGRLKLKKASAKIVGQELVVNADAIITDALDRIIYGLHIIAQDGTEVTAVNNRMILEKDIENAHPGDRLEFSWSMPNIFNDGKYTVTLTFIDDMNNALDWVTNATKFVVRRPERSTTAVLPPIKLKSVVRRTDDV